MENFNLYSKKKKDQFGALIVLSLLTIFFILRAVIKSGHLLFYVICLILLIIVYYGFQWIHKINKSKPASLGKVYAKKYPIIIQFAPPEGINPAEAGLLYNCRVEATDLTSLIYQWKFEKLIDIKTFKGENSNREYIKLIKKNEMPLTRPLFESEIFDSIFAISDVKIIEGSFQLRYALMLEDLEFHGIQKGWVYRKNPGPKKDDYEKSKISDVLSSGIVLLIMFLPLIIEHFNISLDYKLLAGFMVILFLFSLGLAIAFGKIDGGAKLKFTEKGAKLASHVIGYRNFIKSCDENKIRLLLKEDPLFVDRTLPYATAFGLETEFLKKISPLKIDWNAKYVRGEKVIDLSILRFLLKGGDSNSLF